jgi:hypothetical protein
VPTDPPTCRATIRDGAVTLNRWTPGLCMHGPEPAGFRTIAAALADLRVRDDRELMVTPAPSAPSSAEAEEALLSWAPPVGYRRVWLPGRVVECDGALAPIATAVSDCRTCGAHWEDGTIAFWARVREVGWCPGTCLACGGSLPEWSVDGDPAVSDPPGGERPLSHDRRSARRRVSMSDRGRDERHP